MRTHKYDENIDRGSVTSKRLFEDHSCWVANSIISTTIHHSSAWVGSTGQHLIPLLRLMLSAPTIDLTVDSDDDWVADPHPTRLYRAASVGNSWGVTSMGRGFDWEKKGDETEPPRTENESLHPPKIGRSKSDREAEALTAAKRRNRLSQNSIKPTRPTATITPPSPKPPTPSIFTNPFTAEPVSLALEQSRPASPRPLTPCSVHSASSCQPSGSRSPTSCRPRRRSSQQRVSLVAGRVLIAPIEPPLSPGIIMPTLSSQGGTRGIISTPTDVQRSPLHNRQSFLGERNISEFVIEKEIGRGAYGLVKLAREIQNDGPLGVRCLVHQVAANAVLNTGIASTGYQANYQVSYTRRLLETTSKVWYHTD